MNPDFRDDWTTMPSTPAVIEPAGSDHDAAVIDVDGGRTSKFTVMALGLVVLVIVGYFALGMPGMDHSGSMDSMPGMDRGGIAVGWTRQSVEQFADTIARGDTVVINVHVPDEGTIAGTNLVIPFATIVGDASMPTDRTARVALYCRTGRMSTIAAQSLLDAGYRNVVELDGGMDAWRAAGWGTLP